MKVVTDTDSGRIVGIHIVGPSASDLISERRPCSPRWWQRPKTCRYDRPSASTLGEALMEAAAASIGQGLIHMANR